MKVFSFGLLVLLAFLFFHETQAQQKNVRFGLSSGTSTGGSSATSGKSTTTTGSSSTGGSTQNVWSGTSYGSGASCNFTTITVIPSNKCVPDSSSTYQIWSCHGATASLCSSILSDCSDCLNGTANYAISSSCSGVSDAFSGASCYSVDQIPSQSPLPAPFGISTYSDPSCNSSSLQSTSYSVGFTQSSPSIYNYTFCNASGVFSGYCPTSNYSSHCTQPKSVPSSSLNICSKGSKLICGESTVATTGKSGTTGKPTTTAVSAGSFNSPFGSLAIVSVLIALSIWTWV